MAASVFGSEAVASTVREKNVVLVARVHAALLQPYRAKLLFGDPKLTGAEPTQGFLVRLRVQRQLELMNPKHEHTPNSFYQIFVTKSREKHGLCS